jgi:hypothetical protein
VTKSATVLSVKKLLRFTFRMTENSPIITLARSLVWACPGAKRAEMLCPVGQISESVRLICDIKSPISSEVSRYRSSESPRPGVKSFSLPGMSLFGHVTFLDCYELSQTVASLRAIDIVLSAPLFDPLCHFFADSADGQPRTWQGRRGPIGRMGKKVTYGLKKWQDKRKNYSVLSSGNRHD